MTKLKEQSRKICYLRMFLMRVSCRLMEALTVPKVITMMARKVRQIKIKILVFFYNIYPILSPIYHICGER